MTSDSIAELESIDIADVESRLGNPVGGYQLKEAITVHEIRRWIHAMHNPNPLHYDETFASAGEFGGIVAPQSFALACSVDHGLAAATVGRIDGSHVIGMGDEWWFFGPRIHPGQHIRTTRMAFDARLEDSSRFGPSVLQRGDTTYINQLGEVICRQRSSALRYLLSNARRLSPWPHQRDEPEWTDAALEELETQKLDYYRTLKTHTRRVLAEVAHGTELPLRVIGPHSVQSFVSERLSHLGSAWGASFYEEVTPAMTAHPHARSFARLDVRIPGYPCDGACHVDDRSAAAVGLPRVHGYGTSVAAYAIDYAANWVGEEGRVVHALVRCDSPLLVGDATYIRGSVISKAQSSSASYGVVTLSVEMTNQADERLSQARIEVRLPE